MWTEVCPRCGGSEVVCGRNLSAVWEGRNLSTKLRCGGSLSTGGLGGGVEGVCPRVWVCGGSLSTGLGGVEGVYPQFWGVWRESVHASEGGVEGVCSRSGGCGGSLSTALGRGGSLSTVLGGVEGVCPRVWGGGVEGVCLFTVWGVWRESVHGFGVWRESVHSSGGVEGVCPRVLGGRGRSLFTVWGRGGSLSTGLGAWRESVHGSGGCGGSLSTGVGVEGVSTVRGVEGVCPQMEKYSLSLQGVGGVNGGLFTWVIIKKVMSNVKRI